MKRNITNSGYESPLVPPPVQSTIPPVPPPVQSNFPEIRPGLFLDDDIDNISNMISKCNMIESIHVPQENHLYEIQKEQYLTHMINKGNKYAIAVNRFINNDKEEPKPIFGINDTEIDKINNWITASEVLPEPEKSNRFVVFDWDNTLSLSAGFFGITDDAVKKISNNELSVEPSDIISYLFGDDDRLTRIKGVIKNLFDNSIKVYILTRNPEATKNRQLFVDMLKVLDERFDNNSLIYSSSYHKSSDMAKLNKCIRVNLGGKRKTKRNAKNKLSKNRKIKNKRRSCKRK